MSYVGGGGEINITSLDTTNNSWSSPYQIPTSATTNATAAYASVIAETVGTTQQLAVYYVSNDSTSSIYKAFTQTPNSSSGWTANVSIDYSNGAAVQSASGPLALTSFEGKTYIAYQAGSIGTPGNQIVIATSARASTINDGTSWSCDGTFEPNQSTGLGLATSQDGLILSYSASSLSNSLQLKLLTLDETGGFIFSDSSSQALPTTFGTDVSILNLDGLGGGSGLLFAGVNTSSNSYTVQTTRSKIRQAPASAAPSPRNLLIAVML